MDIGDARRESQQWKSIDDAMATMMHLFLDVVVVIFIKYVMYCGEGFATLYL